MPPWLRNLAAAIVARIPAFLSLALLGGIALWGYSNDWKLPALQDVPDKADKKKQAADDTTKTLPGSTDPSSSRPTRIELPSDEAVRKAGFRFAKAQVKPLAQYVTAPGMVDYEPSAYARLTTRATGTVWRVYKEIGNELRKGDILAFIDAAEVGRAKANFLQSLAQLRQSEMIYERLKPLGKNEVVTGKSVLEAEFNFRQARIRLFNDQQALLNLGLPLRLEELQALPDELLVRRLRVLGLPESIQKQLDTETLTANLLPLTAPFDGVVVQRNVAPGELAEATDRKPLFIVADVSQLHLDIDINPADVPALKLGQKVFFRPDSAGAEEAEAKLTHLSPEVDEKTRRVKAHAEVDNTARRLLPNAFGIGRILVNEKPRAVVVPSEAIQSDGKTPVVFVRVSETVFEVRPVRPGIREGDFVEVGGVNPGEEVVTTGSFTLKSELLKDRIAGDE
jgi:membrane fusion protein, heavy metal efflux system